VRAIIFYRAAWNADAV